MPVLDCRLAAVPPALMSCRGLRQLNLTRRQGCAIQYPACTLRALLQNNPDLR